ncbi:alpha/beta hydrolase [Thioclava sediminum]|uniref:Alpha/beta hydrolase n=1 Tax=Thioclava sediminum TaxID=1915319 RepID=A0ABX3MZD9_9RHOB|nr:alpha/beta hydrolase [Thioclava sediminum]OOY24998.1 alpha/beta hydrolase [Thioclava sediminum]
MEDLSGIDWEDAFENGGYIENGSAYPDLWAKRAAEFRSRHADRMTEVAYGEASREKIDLFRPEGASKGLVVFVHGGYWLKFSKDMWSHLAQGALAQGWTVALPGYTLAPENSIPGIAQQIARAIDHAAGLVEGPIHLVGHSAGGHLVTRSVSEGSALSDETAARIRRVISVSGVHDLRPLQMHSMNARLGITPEIAASESPALLKLRPGVKVTVWVGAAERPEFLRQSSLLAEHWPEADLVAAYGRHHFDVIEELSDPSSALVTALLSTD